MPKIERFEDIVAWQKARGLVKEVYRVSSDGRFAKDYSLRDQLRRAAVSMMLNIAEGFARKTSKEFVQSLVIAHGSAAEVQSALYVALDQEYIGREQFANLYGLTEDASKVIMGLSNYLRKKGSAKTLNSKNAETLRTL